MDNKETPALLRDAPAIEALAYWKAASNNLLEICQKQAPALMAGDADTRTKFRTGLFALASHMREVASRLESFADVVHRFDKAVRPIADWKQPTDGEAAKPEKATPATP
jgi:hypothetical protein